MGVLREGQHSERRLGRPHPCDPAGNCSSQMQQGRMNTEGLQWGGRHCSWRRGCKDQKRKKGTGSAPQGELKVLALSLPHLLPRWYRFLQNALRLPFSQLHPHLGSAVSMSTRLRPPARSSLILRSFLSFTIHAAPCVVYLLPPAQPPSPSPLLTHNLPLQPQGRPPTALTSLLPCPECELFNVKSPFLYF